MDRFPPCGKRKDFPPTVLAEFDYNVSNIAADSVIFPEIFYTGGVYDALGAVLGTEVRVKPTTGGYTAELRFTSPDDALALARRIGPRRVA